MIPEAFDPEAFREQGRSVVDHLADYLHHPATTDTDLDARSLP